MVHRSRFTIKTLKIKVKLVKRLQFTVLGSRFTVNDLDIKNQCLVRPEFTVHGSRSQFMIQTL